MTVLTLRAGPAGRIDMTGVLPETVTGRTLAEVAALNVRLDGRPVGLGELFTVTAGAGDTLVVRAEGGRIDCLGRGMAAGTLRLEGATGHYAGRDMTGGELVIEGDAGDFAATGMRGGLLRIAGHAGDWLGAALIGERTGMAGGVVAVAGDAGDRLADRMRRGLILVRGRAGAACGARMLAGTVVAAGGCGPLAGFGLRRGSLILGRAPAAMPATFNDAGTAEFDYLSLLRRHADAFLPGVVPDTCRARRWQGDLAAGGKGEILVPA